MEIPLKIIHFYLWKQMQISKMGNICSTTPDVETRLFKFRHCESLPPPMGALCSLSREISYLDYVQSGSFYSPKRKISSSVNK